MSYPSLGLAVEGSPYREAQVCLGPKFATSTYRFFLSGTSTPANVYQNGALTTAFPITGVVQSDSFGRFPPIYLDPSVTYRVQFFNTGNVQQWQQDPYVSQLATVGTSGLSAFGPKVATTGEITIPAPNTGGTGITLSLSAGAIGTSALQVTGTLPGNSALIINNSVTTGAQTATFTATNKPGTATSSPAGWLPITCDGVQYYAPIWHGNNFTPYAASPTALGEVINAQSVTFTGSGLTTVVGGTAVPSNWFSPASAGIGAGYYIKITKTSGLSAVNFSAANGTFVNISSGGLTVTSNAQATITGTYQLSTSISGSPIVANGTITLSGNNGVQSPSYNGPTPVVFAGDGTATLNGVASTNWYLPTTASIGTGFWLKITPTGGTSGYSFSTATSAPVNIGAGGLSVSITGTGSLSPFVTGTYVISSDSAGLNQLGTGTITINGTSNVQSPNYSGTTPLFLGGDGSATLNGVAASSWFSPNAANTGSGYWVNITRSGGTSGVNFTAAQGSWANITNSGLTIDINGYTGDIGTVSASGTYQISNSNTGSPVLGSGSISLSLSGLTSTRSYGYQTGAQTETVPTGATSVIIKLLGGGGGGANHNAGAGASSGGGGGGGYLVTNPIAVTAGQTLTYNGGTGGVGRPSGTAANGNSGVAATVTGTVNGGTISLSAGGGQGGFTTGSGGNGGTNSATGTASPTLSTNGTGGNGQYSATPQGGAGGNGASPDAYSGFPSLNASNPNAGGSGNGNGATQGGGQSSTAAFVFVYS